MNSNHYQLFTILIGFRTASPVKYARGFINLQKHIFPQQYEQFMTTLVLHFGRNQYFKRRRGAVLLPHEE